MAFSKITLNGNTLMDVTQDTVVPNHLLDGDTATGADGIRREGTLQVDVVVDPTLSVEGDAADAKATGDAINTIKSGLEKVGVYNATEHVGYLQENGQHYADDRYHCLTTDYIPCYAGDVFVYKGLPTAAAVSAIFYDSNKSILSSSHAGSASSYTNITTPPSCAYVVFSSFNAASADVTLDVYKVGAWQEANHQQYYLQSIFTRTGVYISSDGVFRPTSNWICSAYYPVKAGQKVYYNVQSSTAGTFIIGLYTSTYNAASSFVEGVASTLGINRGVYTVSEDGFVVVSTSILKDNGETRFYISPYEEILAAIPTPPTSNGTYTLRCVVSGGVPTYSWVTA